MHFILLTFRPAAQTDTLSSEIRWPPNVGAPAKRQASEAA
jgi:hypothetical protein